MVTSATIAPTSVSPANSGTSVVRRTYTDVALDTKSLTTWCLHCFENSYRVMIPLAKAATNRKSPHGRLGTHRVMLKRANIPSQFTVSHTVSKFSTYAARAVNCMESNTDMTMVKNSRKSLLGTEGKRGVDVGYRTLLTTAHTIVTTLPTTCTGNTLAMRCNRNASALRASCVGRERIEDEEEVGRQPTSPEGARGSAS